MVSFDPVTGAQKSIYTFGLSADGLFPVLGGLTTAGSTLYGTLAEGGTKSAGFIYKIDIPTGAESIVWNFGTTSNDGLGPVGHLSVTGSMLYGTTQEGGANAEGTVFGIDLNTGVENVLYSFRGAQDGLSPQYGVVISHGLLYGVSGGFADSGPYVGEQIGKGAVFQINPATGKEITLHSFTGNRDGGYPEAGLSVINGVLYGSAALGGTVGSGVVFSINPATKTFTNVYDFSGVNGDLTPELTAISDTLYGVSGDGGPSGGNVFHIATATGRTRTLFDFTGSSTGTSPDSPLVKIGDTLYGTTAYGGVNGAGTVFAVDPANGTEKVVYAFQGRADGQSPNNLVALNGTLYGTTGFESSTSYGTVFAVDPTTGSKTTVYVFGHDGGTPNSLIPFQNSLFGTTSNGGIGDGSIFRLDPASKAFKVMHRFQCGNDGCLPYAGMIAYNGSLVGTTYVGGGNYAGSVYSFDPVSGAVKTLYSFGVNQADGTFPCAALLPVGNMLYGTTLYGGSGQGGTVFQLDPATGVETILYNFNWTAADYPATAGGYFPAAPLSYVNGVFYGTTSSGGAGNAGAVFSLTP